jgi:hypothetical protein
MASVLKLKTDIKKLKAAIASKATSGAIKTKLRGKLTTLENELDKLQPNKRKPKTTGPKSESALVKLAKKRRTNQGLSTSKSDIERDAIRPAKPAGRRISADGNRYYEYRDNRVDTRQPPKKYRKLADGGELGEDYREELQEYILDKYTDEYVFGFKLTDSMGEGESPFIWKNEDKNIDVLAIPFYEDENEIHIEVYKDEDQQLQSTDRSYKIVGRKLEDAREYLKILTPIFKKYNNTTIPKKQKIQPAVDVEVLKKREKDMEISEEIADITDGYGPFIYKVGNGYEFDFEKLLQEVKAKKIQKADLDNLMRSSGTIEWKNEVLSKFGNIMSKKEMEKLEKHDGRSVYMKGGYMAKGGKTKDQEVVRGYFEDEAYEYGKGGEVMYLSSNGTSQSLVADKSNATPMWIMDAEYYISSNPKNNAIMVAEKIDETLPDRVGKNYIVKVTKKNKMADGGSVAKGNYEMLMSQAKEVMHHAEELMQVAKPDMDVEAWVVAKAERATTDLSDITHYLDGLKMAMGGMVKHNAHKVNA